MGMFSVLDISAAGMEVQQARLEAAASNLANSRTTRKQDGTVYKPLEVIVRSSQSDPNTVDPLAPITADELPRPVVAGVVESNAAQRLVYEPGHPEADARGFVAYPASDPISMMLDLMNISRTYEANLRAFDVTRSLLQRTIEIGGRR